MNVEPPFQLKHTNVSRPQLAHSGSQQSIAASEDYHSLSENNPSSASDDRARQQAVPRYHTPPSHFVTPAESHEHLEEVQQQQQPETTTIVTTTSLKGVGRVRQQPDPSLLAPGSAADRSRPDSDPRSDTTGGTAVSTILQDYMERRSPDNDEMDDPRPPKQEIESPATTPGMDTTTYIRFAIDQLTRDEEVRGSRHYPGAGAAAAAGYPEDEIEEEEYPVERVVSDEGLGYMAQEQEKVRRLSRPLAPKTTPAPRTTTTTTTTTTRAVPLAAPPTAPPVPAPITGRTRPISSRKSRDPSVQSDIFVPYKADPTSFKHAPLHFKPAILRPLWLSIFIILCLAMLAALIASAVYSNRNNGNGLWDYIAFGDVRYFVFEYLPTILGMIILIWLFQIQIALQRTMPFISMASEARRQRSEAAFLQLFPTQFLLPKVEYFRGGQPMIGVCYVIFWLFMWTIPLLSAAFNVRYDVSRSQWRWVATQGVVYTIVVLYGLLILALLFLMVFLIRRETGLKWDTRSLADVIALLERSNIMNDYDGSETFTKSEFRTHLAGRTDRIGYWHTSRRPNDVFYGIGEEGGETRRYSVEDGRIREKHSREPSSMSRPGDFSIRMDIRSPRVRLAYLPWYLKDTSVVAWIVTGVILLIAFFVISFLNRNVREGFLPQLSPRTNSAGFSPSNFLYSFVPGLIGHLLFLIMLSFDYSIRALQPYMSLSQKGGSTADASLLVDYSARLPISATFAALENRHFQPAFLSLISLCSIAIPILAGGCFWTQYYPGNEKVRVAADIGGYYALCLFLALYALGLFALLPGRRRAALPHRSNSLAEIISWVYQSQILTDRAFNRPQTKPELVARLMGNAYAERPFMRSLTSLLRPSRDNLREATDAEAAPVTEKAKGKGKATNVSVVDPEKKRNNTVLDPAAIRYGFGIHVGRDGLEHLGIDRVRRGGDRSGRELVIWEEVERSSGGRSGGRKKGRNNRRSWAGNV